MMYWALPATTVNPADHEPPSAIAAPASTTIPRSLRRDEIPWERVESLLALSSTTVSEVSIRPPPPPSSSVDRPDAGHADDDSEVAPVATAAVPKAVFRMRGRIVRVTRPAYRAVGLPPSDDILDDE